MNKEARITWVNANFTWTKSQWVVNEGVKLDTGAQVEFLPWAGNHYSDMNLFNLIDNFVKDSTDKEQQKLALYNMSKFGMGMEGEVTDEDLEEYIKQLNN